MKGTSASSSPDVLNVASDELARALVAAVMNDELTPFRFGAVSPAQVAERTGEPMYRVMRRIHRWLGLGILKVESEHKRAGRPIKRYALLAQHFYIPNRVLSIEEVMEAVSAPVQQQLSGNLARVLMEQRGIAGSQVMLSPQTQAVILAQAPNSLWDTQEQYLPAVHDQTSTLHLTHEDARALAEELDDLLTRYRSKEGPQLYMYRLQMTPVLG